jgi:hypothetical protein
MTDNNKKQEKHQRNQKNGDKNGNRTNKSKFILINKLIYFLFRKRKK